MRITTVYFDIDDTLTDYSGKLKTTYVIDEKTGQRRQMTARDTVGNYAFWSQARWKQGAKDMFLFAKRYFSGVETLSKIPDPTRYPIPQQGKEEWVRQNMGNVKTNWVVGNNSKAKYASPHAILVDDKESNIQEFINAKGIGILMTTPQKVIHILNMYVR